MNDVSRRILIVAAPLMAAGACAREPIRTDAAIIDMLRNDRSGFEQALRWIGMDPSIRKMRMRGGALEVDPADIAPRRRLWLADFMGRHGIVAIQHQDGRVRFMVSAAGLGVSGQMKTLEFSPTGQVTEAGVGPPVADTDNAVAADRTRSIVAYRDLGDGWFIRNSS